LLVAPEDDIDIAAWLNQAVKAIVPMLDAA
jgi:hypothetical protein